MLEISDKDFKATIITMPKDIKNNILIMNEKKSQHGNRNYKK